MPGLDGVVAMVDADVHSFAHPFLAVVKNWGGLLVLSKLFSGQYSPHENIVSLL